MLSRDSAKLLPGDPLEARGQGDLCGLCTAAHRAHEAAACPLHTLVGSLEQSEAGLAAQWHSMYMAPMMSDSQPFSHVIGLRALCTPFV